MARYLSASWLAAAQAAVGASAADPLVADAAPVGITQVVDGGPDGTVTYHVSTHRGGATSAGPARLAPGPAEPEDVRFRTSWATSVAVAKGQLSAQRAFVDGDIVVTGDATTLLGARQLLVSVDGAMAAVRATTTYGPDDDGPANPRDDTSS